MDTKVLEYLREKKEYVSTLAVAQDVFFSSSKEEEKERKTEANRVLYRLKAKKLVECKSDEKTGRNPHWIALPETEDTKEKEKIEKQLLIELGTFVPLKTLVEKVGKDRHYVNSILYNLLARKRVEKKLDEHGRNPEWKLLN